MNNIFQAYLRPYLVDGIELIRVGCAYDGGYVIPQLIISEMTKLISVGIEHDIEFEKNLLALNENINIYCFDHTIKSLPTLTKNDKKKFHHIQKGLGLEDEEMVDINTAFNLCDLRHDDVVLFKMDAEGAEWHCGIEEFDFNHIACIVFELHGFSREYRYDLYEKCLKAIAKNHLCLHIHGNNAVNLKEFNGNHYPEVLEATFLHKKFLVGRQKNVSPFHSPRHIDQKNLKTKDEIVFKYW